MTNNKLLVVVLLWCSSIGLVLCSRSNENHLQDFVSKDNFLSYLDSNNNNNNNNNHHHGGVVKQTSSSPLNLTVPLTLIQGADSTGAVCLDGTLPGYHFHPGFGSGANSWLLHLEGGGWCHNVRDCVFRKTTRRGSSLYMEKMLVFSGILSDKPQENPDFYNWNRVKLRYCDGASFAGEGQNEAGQLIFRGQRIWAAGIQELMDKGMKNADQALLSGCSAGGLASILHCDQFGAFFPSTTRVKCLSDAGFFLDATDVAGGHTLREFYEGVVTLQGVQKNLPTTCTSEMDPTSVISSFSECFFPQNLVANIKTPMFLLNAAYDVWQIHQSLMASSADPKGFWRACRDNKQNCNSTQIQYLQDFRNQMLDALEKFSMSNKNGLFINSCFAHCQSERQDTWFADDSPRFGNKRVAEAVGDWYFDREAIKTIDCPYPCDKSCHDLVFNHVVSEITITQSVSESQSTRLNFACYCSVFNQQSPWMTSSTSHAQKH
ncbi:hypothetical protein ACFE04_018221 [Oxalis oulophora]